MMTRGRLVFTFVSLSTLFFFLVGSILASTTPRDEQDQGTDSLYKYLSVFTEVVGLVKRAYVDEPPMDELFTGALEGTTDALDAFSVYVPAESVDSYLERRAIGTKHSGMVVLKSRGVAYVLAVDEGSPSAKAGFEAGDILSEIDGRSTREAALWEIQNLLAGLPGSKVEIERIANGQGKKDTVRLKLGPYKRPGAVLEAKRGVAVLRLRAIDEETERNVSASLEGITSGKLAVPGYSETGKLILDLRGLAGGDEDAAYRVAALFTSGELGALTARQETVTLYKGEGAPLWQGSLVVLVDRGTQGAAEILATVLHQTLEAPLVGERTFGYSGRQKLIKLSNGGHLLLTDAFYTGPDREPINKSLAPDHFVTPAFALFEEEEEETESESDPILEEGLNVLLEPAAEEEEKKAA